MSEDPITEWERAGLYDPRSPDAVQRLELLRYLADVGVTTEEMVTAASIDELVSAAGDKQLRLPRVLTRAQVSEKSGLTPEQVDRAWLAAGPPIGPQGGPGLAGEGGAPLGALAIA